MLASNNHSRALILEDGGLHIVGALLSTLKPTGMALQADLIELAVACARRLVFPPATLSNGVPDSACAATLAGTFGSRMLMSLIKAYPDRDHLVRDACLLIDAMLRHEKNSALNTLIQKTILGFLRPDDYNSFITTLLQC